MQDPEEKGQAPLTHLVSDEEDDDCVMEPAEFVPGPPTESYQESCDRYFWETIGGTRPHPYEH